MPACNLPDSDSDGDGWGWENNRSCKMPTRVIFQSNGSQTSTSQSKAALCKSASSDPDGDGWGWEDGRSCIVGNAPGSNSSGAAATVSPVPVSSGGRKPVGASFDVGTLRRIGGKGDNWCQTWAADDSVITAMSDGDWFDGSYRYHTRLYKMYGDQNGFSRQEVQGYPQFHTNDDGWYGYGMLSVDGTLYSMVSKTQFAAWSPGPFRGVKMLRSYDNGASWNRVDRNNNDRFIGRWDGAVQSTDASEMYFFQESGRSGHGKEAYPFSFVSFVQNGKDHRASRDGYVYIYSPEGSQSNQLMLARVPSGQLGQRSAWQYFAGWNGSSATWSGDINRRQANIQLPAKNSRGEHFGFYSWLPSVVWNEGLGVYVMANGGTYGGYGMSAASHDYYSKWMHTKSGSLGLWYSENPYGPWKQFYYTDHWTPDNAGNLTYQPKLSPKWMSADGKTMTIIWSDAMRNADGYSHSINYKWNQMQVNIRTR
jgi:hypothetical protein